MQPELPTYGPLQALINAKTFDFTAEDRAASGKAIVNIVSMRTGDVTHNQRDLLEDMRVRCGAYLQEQIRALSRNCSNALQASIFSNKKLDLTACYKSKALEHYHELAIDVVREYERQVKLDELVDPDESEYTVGPYQPTTTVQKPFDHAAHPYYDAKSFNTPELEMARALDKFADYVWVRNKDRVGYGIPLPIKSGSSSTFYPDFLWWVKDTIWAIDLKWTPKTGQSNKLLLAVQERGNHGEETAVPHGGVQSPGGVGGGQGGQDDQRVGELARCASDADSYVEEATHRQRGGAVPERCQDLQR